jgi:pilus assembly protein CpaF
LPSSTIPPIVHPQPLLTIRRFTSRNFSMHAVRRGDNILISGGTSTGKTTLLNVMADAIPKSVKMNMTGSVPGFTSEKPIRIEPWIGRGKGLGGN